MNIYIEFIKKVFCIDNNTAASIIITLLVAVISALLAWLYRVCIRMSDNKKLIKLFKSSVRKIIEQFEEQSLEFGRFSDTLNFENDIFVLKRTPLLPISVFEHIGYNKWVEVLVLNNTRWNLALNNKEEIEQTDVFFELWNLIITSYYWKERSVTEFEKFIIDYNILREQHNKNHTELFEYLIHIESDKNGNLSQLNRDYLQKLSSLRNTWSEKDAKGQSDVYHKFLIKPLFEFISINQNVIYSPNLLPYIAKSMEIYTNQERLLKLQKNMYVEYSSNFLEDAKSCSEYLKKLN